MPHIEQQATADLIDFSWHVFAEANHPAGSEIIPMLQCLAAEGAPLAREMASGRKRQRLGALNYFAPFDFYPYEVDGSLLSGLGTGAGAWRGSSHTHLLNSSCKQGNLVDVTDGRSNTILLYEDAWANRGFPATVEVNNISTLQERRATWIAGHLKSILIGDRENFAFVVKLGDFRPNSQHGRGANIAMVDGSVHFLSYDSPPVLLLALLTRDGEERLERFDWP